MWYVISVQNFNSNNLVYEEMFLTKLDETEMKVLALLVHFNSFLLSNFSALTLLSLWGYDLC